MLKEFYELADEGSTAHTGAKNKLDGFIDAGKASFIVNNADLRKLNAVADALPYERQKFVDLFSTQDQAKGVNAFLEKRPPFGKIGSTAMNLRFLA